MPARYPYLRRVHFRPAPPARTIVFLHIPKTAGKSLRSVLLARIGRHSYFSIAHPLDDYRRLEVLHHEDRAALALVEGHLYYGIHELLPRPSVYLTLLRDPVERVLSLYSFIRQSPAHHLHQQAAMPLGECLERGISVELDNFMVRSLSSLSNLNVPYGSVTREMLAQAKRHLDEIGGGVGLTERFDESLTRFGALLRWRGRRQSPRLNTTVDRLRRESIATAELELLERHNALDRELYEHAARLFARA